MARKNKKKPKKVSAKKLKYQKYKKDKPSTIDISMPDLTDEQVQIRKTSDTKIDRFLRFSRNKPAKSIREKKLKSK